MLRELIQNKDDASEIVSISPGSRCCPPGAQE